MIITAIAVAITALLVWLLTYKLSQESGEIKGYNKAMLDIANMQSIKKNEADKKFQNNNDKIVRLRNAFVKLRNQTTNNDENK